MNYQSAYASNEPTRAEVDVLAGPTVLEFGAPWCGHCLALQADLQDLLDKFPGVRHVKIYDGRGKPLGRSFRVKLWPNLVFLRDGNVALQLARPDAEAVRRGLEAITVNA